MRGKTRQLQTHRTTIHTRRECVLSPSLKYEKALCPTATLPLAAVTVTSRFSNVLVEEIAARLHRTCVLLAVNTSGATSLHRIGDRPVSACT